MSRCPVSLFLLCFARFYLRCFCLLKYFQYWTYVPTSCLRADTIGTPNRTQERRGTSEERDRSGAKIGLNSVWPPCPDTSYAGVPFRTLAELLCPRWLKGGEWVDYYLQTNSWTQASRRANRHGGCMSIPEDRMRGTIKIGALHRPSVTTRIIVGNTRHWDIQLLNTPVVMITVVDLDFD